MPLRVDYELPEIAVVLAGPLKILVGCSLQNLKHISLLRLAT